MSAQTERDARGAERDGGPRPLAEWVSFGVAAAVLFAVAGLVIYLWVAVPATPPAVSVTRAGPVRREGGQFYIPFRITNSGGLTADAVVVRAELAMGDQTVEESELVFDFLSGGEAEEGAFIFTHDPAEGQLELRVGGYRLP